MKVSKIDKTAFISAIICGFVSYGYILTHHFLTYDSMWNLYSNQNMISSGRQFLMFVCRISSDYDLPWLNGLLAIFYLAISSVVTVRLFNVSKVLSATLVAGVIVMFPSVTSTFAYTYTVDGYMFAILLATLSVYVAKRYRYGFLAGIVLLGISIGIYQAYFSYAIILCIVLLLLLLLDKVNGKEIMVNAIKLIVMGIGAYFFYVITLKIMLSIEDEVLSGYQGTETVVGFSVSQIPLGIRTAFWSFVDFARWENVLTTTLPMKYAFIGLLLISGFTYIYLFIVNGCFKEWYRILASLTLFAVIPFGATMVAILSPDTYMHLLTRMPWAVLFVFLILLIDKIETGKKHLLYVKKMGYVCGFILIFEFAVVANIVGFNMNERYEKTYALCLRIADRLEQTDGYETGMPVAILGGFPNEENYPSTDITKKDLIGYFGVSGDLCVNATGKYAEFMAHYLNVTIKEAGWELENSIANSGEYNDMKNFPSKDSIMRIGDVWVVKLNG